MSISLDKLKEVRTIISHGWCADGVAAAVFCKSVLPEAEVRFIQYSTLEHRMLEATPGMLFCDFSPHPDRLKEFVDAGAIVLDHHMTSREVVEAFGENGIFGDENKDPGVCGAVLAHDHVWSAIGNHSDEERAFAKKVATLSGIRDTWQRDSEQWRMACVLAESFRFYPEKSWLEVAAKDRIFSAEFKRWWEERWEVGQILRQRTEGYVDYAVNKALRFTTPRGTRVAVISGTKLTSDTADAIHEDADLLVGFKYGGIEEDGRANLTFSTRSHTNFNCAEFCNKFGGGGHTKAAGFSITFDPDSERVDPYTELRRFLKEYEGD